MPPPKSHKRSSNILRLRIVSLTVAFALTSINAVKAEIVIDTDNPLSGNKIFDNQETVNNQKVSINAKGLNESTTYYLSYVENSEKFSAQENDFSLEMDGESLSNLYALHIKTSNDVTIGDNQLTYYGAENSKINNLYLVNVADVFPTSIWDEETGGSEEYPGIGSNGVMVQDNHLYVYDLHNGGAIRTVSASHSGGEIRNNTLFIEGSDFREAAAVSGSSQTWTGSKIESLDVIGNSTTIHDSTFRNAYGVYVSGQDLYGQISDNSLTLKNVTVKAQYGISNVFGQYSGAKGNSTQEFPQLVNGSLSISGKLTLTSSDNKTVNLGGSYSLSSGVEDSKVIIQDATLDLLSKITKLSIYGGYSADSDVNGSTVTIDNSIITSNKTIEIYGANHHSTGEMTGVSNNNNIEIKNNSVISGKIVAGWSNVEAVGNTVTIDSSTIDGSIEIFGGNGKTKQGSGSVIIKGNSNLVNADLVPHRISNFTGISDTNLTLDGYKGQVNRVGYTSMYRGEVEKAYSFDHINFINQIWSDDSTILSIVDDGNVSGGSTFLKSSFTDSSLSFVNPEAILPGSSITLVSYESASDVENIYYQDQDGLKHKTIKGNAGTSTEFSGEIYFGDKEITYTIEGLKPAEQTTIVGDSRAAASAFVNHGSDLLERVFQGFTLSREKYGLMTFATAEGLKSDYDLTNSLKINGWNFLAGVRSITPRATGDLTTAAFFEYGQGNYRTHNDHLGIAFRTDGEVEYTGGGFAIRYVDDNGLYGETSLRAGYVSTDLNHALMDGLGNFYNVSTDSIYAGLHLGLGAIVSPISNLEIDNYGKFFFTYTDSDEFKVNSESYQFDSILSNRLRIGSRASLRKDNVTFMMGLAAEYEFSGESDMIAANTPTKTSDFGGFSAFGEFGVSVMPTVNSPWQFDFQVRAWEGKRDALTGLMTVNYLM